MGNLMFFNLKNRLKSTSLFITLTFFYNSVYSSTRIIIIIIVKRVQKLIRNFKKKMRLEFTFIFRKPSFNLYFTLILGIPNK
jgi:hypothetical protein